jgi:hypothetical protein
VSSRPASGGAWLNRLKSALVAALGVRGQVLQRRTISMGDIRI